MSTMEKKKKEERITVLAESKTSGHKHQFNQEVTLLQNTGGEKVIAVKENTVILHEEHGPVSLSSSPSGKYVCGTVKQWDSLAERAKSVED